jgi:hypothetical protein
MSEYITELENLYIAIGNMIGPPSDEQLTRINELESLFNPDTIKSDCVYRCPRCGSEWCEDDGIIMSAFNQSYGSLHWLTFALIAIPYMTARLEK